MRTYRVRARPKGGGDPVTVIVSARSGGEALSLAEGMGLDVEEIRERMQSAKQEAASQKSGPIPVTVKRQPESTLPPNAVTALAEAVKSAPRVTPPLGVKPESTHTVTIEKTAKVFKVWMLVGLAMVLLSFPTCICGASIGMEGGAAAETAGHGIILIGWLLFGGGLVTGIGAKLFAWWHHG